MYTTWISASRSIDNSNARRTRLSAPIGDFARGPFATLKAIVSNPRLSDSAIFSRLSAITAGTSVGTMYSDSSMPPACRFASRTELSGMT